MEDVQDRVRRFLSGFTSLQEKDLQDFISYVAIDNPSLDRDSFRKNLLKSIEQRDELKAYEKELLSVTKDSPFYSGLEKILKEAREGHENLEDIGDELNAAKKFFIDLKANKKTEGIPQPEAPGKPSEAKADAPPGLVKDELQTQPEAPGKPSEAKADAPPGLVKDELQTQPEAPGMPSEAKADAPPGLVKDEVQIQPEAAPDMPSESKAEEPPGTVKDEVQIQPEAAPAAAKSTETEILPPEAPEEMMEEAFEEEITATETSPEAALIPENKEQNPHEEKPVLREGAEDLMRRLNLDDTKTLLKDHMTPEKQAVFELLEEKLMSDVETRIKKLKEIQTKVLEEEQPKTLVGKIKTFLTKEAETIEAYDISLHGPLVTFEGLEGFNEIERYWVNEPYSFVVILFDPENNNYLYFAAEPVLTEFEDLFLKEIKDRLKDILLVENVKTDEDKHKTLTAKVRQLVKDYAIDITPLTLEKVMYYTRRDFIYFGKIDPLMHDNRIEDISSNGFDIPIYLYHKKYTNIPTNIYFKENDLNSYVIRLAQRCGKHISVAEPMVDATMPDGSRIQMTLGTEVTSRGSTFTIRKFSEIPITPVDLIKWNTFSAEELAYLWLCIENNKSLIYAGGTASGKTSSLNAVSLFIPPQAKIVTLEDTRELKLPHPNWIPGVTRDSFTPDGRGGIDMYELLRAALRQRPEFLLVGEVRGKEALTLFQAMSTGHTTFSTMHADSVASAIHRLENPPISVPRTMIQALNIISIQSQTYVGGKRARRNMKLVEITDIDPTTRNIRTNDIFIWDPLTDKFLRVGESKALNEIMVRRGWNLLQLKKELSNRQKILEFMVNNKITDFHAISTIIHDYQSTPEKVLTKLNITGN